jgi:hypothetical protein
MFGKGYHLLLAGMAEYPSLKYIDRVVDSKIFNDVRASFVII